MQNHDAIQGIFQQSVHLLTTNVFHITQASFLLLNYYNPSSNLMTSRCNSTSNLMTSRSNPTSNLMTSRCDPTSNLMTSRCNRISNLMSSLCTKCNLHSLFDWFKFLMVHSSDASILFIVTTDITVFKSFIY